MHGAVLMLCEELSGLFARRCRPGLQGVLRRFCGVLYGGLAEALGALNQGVFCLPLLSS